jgi:hypothetical protein
MTDAEFDALVERSEALARDLRPESREAVNVDSPANVTWLV